MIRRVKPIGLKREGETWAPGCCVWTQEVEVEFTNNVVLILLHKNMFAYELINTTNQEKILVYSSADTAIAP